ncbi:hypothetical protein RE432_05215 [Pusillimonas sp. SM2304]|uniref:hypothetical protein n=1 Tax=Pusillimonas sp. SM2304 TaxID=3073241 RepID=UPI002876F785|nr:hypothetical protein [Pusillimonas sp. SM2304]MDS1139825.1 hypothetical protein [Pusillimonas sp. SM2304]
MSGHWPDRPSSAPALIARPDTGSLGAAKAVAREAGTAPATLAFLKNEDKDGSKGKDGSKDKDEA